MEREFMTRTIREWTCDYASATGAGDYFQVLFKQIEDNDKRYVLIQSQFELPQDYDVKVEADGGEWYAELTVHRATLDRQRLVIDGSDDGEPIRIIVNHAADDGTYADLKRVLPIMVPAINVK
jgi:hypothetical protein